jgi:uncharacterized repeat protein (TIGR03837 family)
MQGWDIFCRVIDNYGDIGVTWRLARQLAAEHGIAVRLWVDEPAALARLCPQADPALERQRVLGVELRHWDVDADTAQPADVVIEAFGCELPEAYVARMAEQARPPVWINLEYLSAEGWVDGHHGLASPHPRLPLTKYFFFPGFTPATGGLLRERDLFVERDAFQTDAGRQDANWQGLGIAPRKDGELRVSLFAYENPGVAGLLQAWAEGARFITCLVPEGRVLPQVGAFFGAPAARPGKQFIRGRLTVKVLPFTDQPGYDRLLWGCDLNFVRGEDSFVRALWAGRPLVWQIYPQDEDAHQVKLAAFWQRYRTGLDAHAAAALNAIWQGWNGATATDWPGCWGAFTQASTALIVHGSAWSAELASKPDLASQLVEFAQKVDK